MRQFAVINDQTAGITAAEAKAFAATFADQGLPICAYTGANIKALTNMPLTLMSPAMSFLTACASPQAARALPIVFDHDGTADGSEVEFSTVDEFTISSRTSSICPGLLVRVEPTGVENSLSTTFEITGTTALGAFHRRFVCSAKGRASHEFMLLPFGECEAQNVYSPFLVGRHFKKEDELILLATTDDILDLFTTFTLTVKISGGKNKQIRVEMVNINSADMIPHFASLSGQ